MLLKKMNSNTGRIVVTASGVHDPDSPGGAQGSKATLGDLSGLRNQGRYFEMIDGGSFDADKAYKDSKVRQKYASSQLSSIVIFLIGTLCYCYIVVMQYSFYSRTSTSIRAKWFWN